MMIKGRQIAFLVDQHYLTQDAVQAVYDMNDLQLIKYPGDHMMDEWRAAFRDCIQGFREYPTPEQWKQIEWFFVEELRKSKQLTDVINKYDWVERGEEKKTYEWLNERITFWLSKRRKDDNRKDIAEMFKRGKYNVMPGETERQRQERKRRESELTQREHCLLYTSDAADE